MKHSLIAGLVLAVSFVLMLPPENQDSPGTFDTTAPLSDWQPYASRTTGIQEGAGRATEFPTLRQCVAAKLAWADRWKTLGNQNLSNAYRSGRCVRSDDPALNQ